VGKLSKALNKIGAGSAFQPEHAPVPPPPPLHEEQSTPAGTVAAHKNKKKNSRPKADPFPLPAEQTIDNWNERLVYAIENFSGVAESFRKLRTLILHPESGDPARSIMVLSSDPQEGKSFVCANLGVSFAHSVGQKALMVDCDLRRPSLQGLFGLNHPKGLTEYLGGEKNISDVIYSTGLHKLSIIPAGSIPENPAELISSEKMADMMEELTNRYSDRLILLDTPPFHAAAETLVLSQLVDKVVLVIRWGKAGRENVKKMIEHIGREKIIGVVFNAFEMNILDRKVQGVGYHDYYTESYY
jgi:exopolysaccharide/PEP-CTERM locus tyrosine autokinase